MRAKPGRLSKLDQQWILDNRNNIEVEHMAEKLGKKPELIHKFIRENGGETAVPRKDKVSIREELRSSEEWKRLKLEFSGEELKLFEEKFIVLMAQFKSDGVLPSEEAQIIQAIKYTILMSRNLMARSKALAEIRRVEESLDAHLDKYKHNPATMDASAKQYALVLETQLQAARASEQAHTNEYVKFQERYDNIMKQLKATRDQRVKDIQSSKINFLALAKMLQQKEMQEREGRSAELMRLAGAKEYQRLGALHRYENGELDRPILTHDTLDIDGGDDVATVEEREA